MSRVLFALPGAEHLAGGVAERLGATLGLCTVRHFPDGESYVRLLASVKGAQVVVLASLKEPDGKFLPLHYLAQTAKELGATEVGLVAPYLAYMRQDKRFQEGEAVTAPLFAKLLSQTADWLVTVDPHLHRHKDLSEIYSIPAAAAHCSKELSAWIGRNVPSPVLVGPDSESAQWVRALADATGAPYVVSRKIRKGDRQVEVSVPGIEDWQRCTPVIVDDIISTGATMFETVRHLRSVGTPAPVCLAVHGVFTGRAYEDLLAAGAAKVVTTNSLPHATSEIDLTALLAKAAEERMKG